MAHRSFFSKPSLLTSEYIDTSDFILFAIELLEAKKILDPKIQAHAIIKEKILLNYLFGEYDTASDTLLVFVKEKLKSDINNDHLRILKILQKSLQVAANNDNPVKNQSKRMFESQLSLFLWNALDHLDFEILEKLNSFIKPMESSITDGYLKLGISNEKKNGNLIGLSCAKRIPQKITYQFSH